MTTKLRVDAVSKGFARGRNGARRRAQASGSPFQALTEISFDVHAGEVLVLIGPSGCGKSTLLSLIHGLGQPDEGAILVDGREVREPGFDRALVFQHGNLLPWRSAKRNVTLGLESMGVSKTEREKVAQESLELVGLAGFEDFYPHQLSGGMQQRVGIARALAVDPEILLMDEPFGALDAQTRERLQQEFGRINARTRQTVIFVTHDLDEALYLGDRIVVLTPQPGRVAAIVDVDLPRPRPSLSELRAQPAFVEARQHLWSLLDHGSP